MRTVVLALALATASLLAGPVLAPVLADDAAEKKAAEEGALGPALAWLKLVDEGRYERSWEEAALLFKTALTKEGWTQALNGVRKPLGELARIFHESSWLQMQGAGCEAIVTLWRAPRNAADAAESARPQGEDRRIFHNPRWVQTVTGR